MIQLANTFPARSGEAPAPECYLGISGDVVCPRDPKHPTPIPRGGPGVPGSPIPPDPSPPIFLPGGTCEGQDPYAVFTEHARAREGYSNRVYADSLGKPTVGIGHLVLPEDNLKLGDVISDERVMEFWHKDSAGAFGAAMKQAESAGICDPCFVAALASVNYQMGTGWRKKFPTIWALIEAGRYDEAADRLEGTLWNRQTPVRVRDIQIALRALPPKAPSCTLEPPEKPLPPGICDIAPEYCEPICYGECGPLPPVNCDTDEPIEYSCSSPKDNLFLNPFTWKSAIHRPIGCDAIYGDENHPMTRAILAQSFGNVNAGEPFGKSMFEATTADPPMNVDKACDGGAGELPFTSRIPALARLIEGPCGTDGVIAVYDPVTRIGSEIRSYAWNGGNPRGSSGFQNLWTGLGHPEIGAPRVGSSASGTTTVFGIIRGHEVNTPGYHIEHISQLTFDRFGRDALLKDQAVWPAVSTDGSCGGGHYEDGVPDCSGPIPYGQLLAIPRDVNLDALGLSEPGRRLADALQRYGARPNDGTGHGVNMRADQYVTDPVRNQLKDDMKKLFHLLRPVLNDAPGQTASGGGNPMAPNCAFDAPPPPSPP